jgi:hypothetical protein
MSVVPGTKAISAQLLQTIDMAVAISVLCAMGGFKTSTPYKSTVRPVKSHAICAREARLLVAFSPFSICLLYRL